VAKQERVQKQKSQARAEDTHIEESNSDVTNAELAEKTEQVVSDIDDVLDAQLDEEILAELDDVLEENAAEFVSNYVQQGGE
jgi:ubiquitin-like protein Pup